MRQLAAGGFVLGLSVLGLGAMAERPSSPPVVLISIDGLRPGDVLEADRHGLRIPNLRRLLREGAHATSVVGVLPTVTYPSHTTLVTGVSPARHGIYANKPFDPTGNNADGWYWFAEDIRVPTLWEAAARAGLTTGAVDWPVTVGANITYNIAQYWRAPAAERGKLIRVLSTRGLLAESEPALGSYPSGDAWSVDDDQRRAAFNVYILERKRPRLHLCYFSSLDAAEHESGPGSAAAFAALERIDALVGQVGAAAESAGGGRAVIAVASDHGFVRTARELHLNAVLAAAGLIQVDAQGRVAAWDAFAWSSGSVAAVQLRDQRDARTRELVAALLSRLAARADSGIERVLTPPAAAREGGFPDAAFVVCLRPDVRFGDDTRGTVIRTGWPAGTHGVDPSHAEMDAAFFIAGPGIGPGLALGRIDMRDVAPTLAGRLGLRLPEAEGRDLLAPHATLRASR